jgi:hypothetical protein
VGQFVPATTKVHRTKVHNVATERLMRRRFHLIYSSLPRIIRDGGDASRNDFATKVAELCVIEDALDTRGEPIHRRTIAPARRGRWLVTPRTGAAVQVSLVAPTSYKAAQAAGNTPAA